MSSEKGQSLMELVVVMSVLVIVVGALVFATIASIRNAQFGKNQAQATKLAQEGMEWVRTGRDRNKSISISGTAVTSWNGSGNGDSIWGYHISGNCDRPDLASPGPGKCYFKVDSAGGLTGIGFAQTTFPSLAEVPPGSTAFKRAILLSDDLNHNLNFNDDDYQNQKEVTAVVTWTDFAGGHESRLATILRRI